MKAIIFAGILASSFSAMALSTAAAKINPIKFVCVSPTYPDAEVTKITVETVDAEHSVITGTQSGGSADIIINIGPVEVTHTQLPDGSIFKGGNIELETISTDIDGVLVTSGTYTSNLVKNLNMSCAYQSER
jgi:hypothetical protein